MDINLEQHKKHYMESDKRAYMNLYIAYMNLSQHEKQYIIANVNIQGSKH
jgi:hypothetical protein